MHALARRKRHQRGAAMIEFALVMPILIVLVFGIIEFGRAYNAQITLSNSAREAAREYSLTQDGAAADIVGKAVATTLDDTQMTPTWSGCESSGDIGNPATFSYTYPITLTIPLWKTSAINLSSTTVMRCGG